MSLTREAIVLLTAVAGVGCRGSGFSPATAPVVTGGDSDRGAQVITERRCGDCHEIPGVLGARGVVAAPLQRFALRTYIAGIVPNTPENLVRWIRVPTEVEPRTAMPNLGLDEREARDAAAYLYTLR